MIQRLRHFTEAARLLGGNAVTARALKITERTVRRLLAGQAELHDGFMRDIAIALDHHAASCSALARAIHTTEDNPNGQI
jgi:hypothetical protein